MFACIAMAATADAQQTANYVTKFGVVPAIKNSLIFDDGTNVSVNYGGAGNFNFDVNGDLNAGGSYTTTTNAFF